MDRVNYIFVSKAQKELYKEVKKLYDDALLNYPIRTCLGKLYFGDVVIPSQKVIIEYDGEYWHRGREGKDGVRDMHLAKEGWKVIHIKESDWQAKKVNIKTLIEEASK